MLNLGRACGPEPGHSPFGNLLKSGNFKCFRWNGLQVASRGLLIFVGLGCFGCYKFDYKRRAKKFAAVVVSFGHEIVTDLSKFNLEKRA